MKKYLFTILFIIAFSPAFSQVLTGSTLQFAPWTGNLGIGGNSTTTNKLYVSGNIAQPAAAIFAEATSTSTLAKGVEGFSPNGSGIYGESTGGVGVFGMSSTGYAGYFNGNLYANQDLIGLQSIHGLNSLKGLQSSDRLEIFSGLDDTQGGYIRLYGNNHSSDPGNLSLVAGEGSGGTAGSIKFYNRTATTYDLHMEIHPDGDVEIGDVVSPTAKLHIRGDLKIQNSGGNQIHLREDGFIRCRQLDVDLVTIPDYVFDADYPLLSLDSLSTFINENHHLPGIKSASEYEEEGSINLGELNIQLLEKVEELTLYVLELKKEIEEIKMLDKIKK